jgi:phytoene dehydrogenase-like protein
METDENSYDVIIIGSGMGALTCASLLAQVRKKRVLVLERHFKLGGFTHVFRRQGKYDWDVGVHYVGEMENRAVPRTVMDYITRGQLNQFAARLTWRLVQNFQAGPPLQQVVAGLRTGASRYQRCSAAWWVPFGTFFS